MSALFDLYVSSVTGDPPLTLDPAEVCESAWVSFDEALRRCDADDMAGPWVPRLDQLGERLAERVGEADQAR